MKKLEDRIANFHRDLRGITAIGAACFCGTFVSLRAAAVYAAVAAVVFALAGITTKAILTTAKARELDRIAARAWEASRELRKAGKKPAWEQVKIILRTAPEATVLQVRTPTDTTELRKEAGTESWELSRFGRFVGFFFDTALLYICETGAEEENAMTPEGEAVLEYIDSLAGGSPGTVELRKYSRFDAMKAWYEGETR